MNTMKKVIAIPAGLLLVSLALPAPGAGPAVVNGLEAQLKAIEMAIASAESQLKQRLEGYGEGAGEQGLRLRRLRREHAELERQLKVALDAEAERMAADAVLAPTAVTGPGWPVSVPAPPAPTPPVGKEAIDKQAPAPPDVTPSGD